MPCRTIFWMPAGLQSPTSRLDSYRAVGFQRLRHNLFVAVVISDRLALSYGIENAIRAPQQIEKIIAKEW
jgi:hypothetical protein